MRYTFILLLGIQLLVFCSTDGESTPEDGSIDGDPLAEGGTENETDASSPANAVKGGSGGQETGQEAGSDGNRRDAMNGAGGTGLDSGEPNDSGRDTGRLTDSTSFCQPLPEPSSNTIVVAPAEAASLAGTVASAEVGDTVLLEDGTYELDGAALWINASGVTIRSRSGDRDAVILDGAYRSTEIVTVAASNVTVADLTIKRAYTHAIHVVSTDQGDTLDTLIYNVHIVDSREQAIKINPHAAGIHFTDSGTLACSHLELTDAGRPHVNPDPGGCYTGGVDAHQSRGWIIRDNRIEGFWCPEALAEHGVHMWRGCRDTLVERNRFIDNARAVGLGMANSGEARVYEDDPCPVGGYVGHQGGIVRNNFIFASRPELTNASGALDCGICFWSACRARALHNTIVSTGGAVSAIEWRFATSTGIEIANNLVTHQLWERENASAVQYGNLTVDSSELTRIFVDATAFDFHLTSDAETAIDQGVPITDNACPDDIDGERRQGAPDIGADELSSH